MQQQTNNFGQTLEQRLEPSIARAQQLMAIIMQSMRVALPGVVQSFSAGPPATVTVLISTNELVAMSAQDGPLSIETDAIQLPVLKDVPVCLPFAGGWNVTFPIKAGDECLVVFADAALDVWLQNGGLNNNPISQRRHSLSDGVAVFGLRSTPRALSGWSTSSMQIRDDAGDVVIDLAPGQITITAATVTINASNQANVTSPTVSVTGSSQVNITSSTQVTISGSGHTSIEGHDFLPHRHGGVQAGSNVSGGVV